MKHETRLTPKEEGIVSRLVDTGRFGDCSQDVYLIHLLKHIRRDKNRKYGMMMPHLVLGNEEKFRQDKTLISYSINGNYRTLFDMSVFPGDRLSDERVIFAYFDYPVAASALYLGTFNNSLILQLLDSVGRIGANAYSTSTFKTPMTVKVDMNSFENILRSQDGSTYRDTPSEAVLVVKANSIKYLTDRILGPEELFDVIDIGKGSNNFL